MAEKTKAKKAKTATKTPKKAADKSAGIQEKVMAKKHSKARRRLFWYASVALVGTAVVYGVQYEESATQKMVEKPIVSRTKTTQIDVISEPGIIVTAATAQTTSSAAADNSRLESIQSLMKLMTKLENRLTETEVMLQSVSQQANATSGLTKDNLVFSEMVSELRDNYQRGDVLLEQITQLQLFARDVMQDIAMSDSLETLLSVTPTEGPVTLAELAMMAAKTQMRGLPSADDMIVKPVADAKEDVSFVVTVKAWFAGLIKVRKIEGEKAYDLAQPWVIDMEQLQIYLLRGRADAAQNFIMESETLANDKRLMKLSHTLDLYLRQQQALQAVLNAYTG